MSHPGKFQACADLVVAERLHAQSLDGGCDEEIVLNSGEWYALMADAILTEDEYGFFGYALFPSEGHAVREWEAFKAQCRAEGDLS